MELILKIIGIVGLIALIALLLTLPIMWLWNWLMPDIFGLTEITFWQALGIAFLARLIFSDNTGK